MSDDGGGLLSTATPVDTTLPAWLAASEAVTVSLRWYRGWLVGGPPGIGDHDIPLPSDAPSPVRLRFPDLPAEHSRLVPLGPATIEYLSEQLRLAIARRFGPSAERVSAAQLGLFNEAEVLAEQDQTGDADSPSETHDLDPIAVPAHTRARGKRRALPAHLPRVVVPHELAEEQQVCPHDGTRLERFGEQTCEQLDIVPAKIQVLQHVRATYRCPCCREHIITAPLPAQPIPKSQASPGLLAYC